MNWAIAGAAAADAAAAGAAAPGAAAVSGAAAAGFAGAPADGIATSVQSSPSATKTAIGTPTYKFNKKDKKTFKIIFLSVSPFSLSASCYPRTKRK